MSASLENFLIEHQVDYQLVPHRYTDTAFNTASTAHIRASCMVKGVLLQDQQGYIMIALGADRALDINQINHQLNRQLALADEQSLARVLDDCALGAVPALGQAFGIATLWDQQLGFQPGFYIEAGNHQELVRLSHTDFMCLMNNSDQCVTSPLTGTATRSTAAE